MSDQVGENLRGLAILHYALAVATALAGVAGVVLILVGGRMANQGLARGVPAPRNAYEDPQVMGLVYMLAGAIFLTLCLVHAVVVGMVGRWIHQRRHFRLCRAFAIFHLVNFPLGSGLSVYTLWVLRRARQGGYWKSPATSERESSL